MYNDDFLRLCQDVKEPVPQQRMPEEAPDWVRAIEQKIVRERIAERERFKKAAMARAEQMARVIIAADAIVRWLASSQGDVSIYHGLQKNYRIQRLKLDKL